MTKHLPVLALATAVLTVVTSATADGQDFRRTKLSVLDGTNREIDVALRLTDDSLVITDGEGKRPDINISYTAIDRLLYEFSQRRRIGEGAAVAALSLGAGAVTMLTKAKSHWLSVQHSDANAPQTTTLRLHKNDYKQIIAALEARTGKAIETVEASQSTLNPAAASTNVDAVVAFPPAKVFEALKPAMERVGCRITSETTTTLECKRDRGYSDRTGAGGEKVTATITAKGDQTHLRIETGKGFVGRLMKRNWSTPIYDDAIRRLNNSQTSGV